MKRLAAFLWPLLAALAMAGDPPRGPSGNGGAPPPRPFANQPPDQRIGALLLPQVKFRDADFEGALGYFRRKAEQESGGVLKLVFVRDLPADFRPRHELTLELKNAPFTVALNYLGELAGVQFTIAGTTITAKTGTAPPPKDAPLPQNAPFLVKGSGALSKPAAPASVGNNAHWTTEGVFQADKSGNVPHRSTSGWSTAQDPGNKVPTNCSHSPPCNGRSCPQPCQCKCACLGTPYEAPFGKAKPSP